MQKSNFLELVAKERTRQIVEKGYTAKHDSEHTDGALADAAECLLPFETSEDNPLLQSFNRSSYE